MKTQTDKTSPQDQARAFKAKCQEYGWTYSANRNEVIEIQKRIIPGSNESFTTADMEYGELLGMVPMKGGSVWGTDGGGIGGMVAMRTGQMSMKKSGSGAKRFMDALRKL